MPLYCPPCDIGAGNAEAFDYGYGGVAAEQTDVTSVALRDEQILDGVAVDFEVADGIPAATVVMVGVAVVYADVAVAVGV